MEMLRRHDTRFLAKWTQLDVAYYGYRYNCRVAAVWLTLGRILIDKGCLFVYVRRLVGSVLPQLLIAG